MREFGSDFHYINSYNSGCGLLTDVFRGATLLADGRQCIVALIRQNGWKRLWMPDYFCYEVIETIKGQTGIEVIQYEDNPLCEGDVEKQPYEDGDVLLRMNYFGMRDFRSNKNISVPVIEDHSHDPFGHWALYSDADWCIASLRKSLPLPEGGMMWSPKQLRVSFKSLDSSFKSNQEIAALRWNAMETKAAYLWGEDVSKDEFRRLFVETEEWFDHAEPSKIDERSKEFVCREFDVNLWFSAKKQNWSLLNRLINKEHCEVINAESESCTMFSLILLLENEEQRNAIRCELIERCVYPAILWNLPEEVSTASKDFCHRMLSIHCDGRYTEDDIRQLANILNQTLEK